MLAMLPQQNPEKCVVRLLGNYQIVCVAQSNKILS